MDHASYFLLCLCKRIRLWPCNGMVVMTVTYMKDGSPKSWDKSLRRYEIIWPDGRKEIWKDITARDCLTRYENMDPMGNGLRLREIVGNELQLQKATESK